MDETLFRIINNLASHSVVLDWIGVFFASGLIWVMMALLVFFVAIRKQQVMVFFIAAAAGLGAWAFNQLISLVYFRMRPFAALSDMHQLIAKEAMEKGFPSDHTAIAFAVATAVFLVNRKWGIIMFVLAVFVALGRVFVGVHYPLDVLAGAIVGIGCAALTCYLVARSLRFFQKKEYEK